MIERFLKLPAIVALLIAAAGGGLCGEAAWRVLLAQRAEEAPAGWVYEDARVPYRLTDLAGPSPHRAGAWSLAHWRGIGPTRELERSRERRLEVQALLPQDSQLEIVLSEGGGDGDGTSLLVERVGEPSVVVVSQVQGRRRELPCSSQLRVGADEQVEIALQPGSLGLLVGVDGEQERCALGAEPTWDPVLRPGLQRVHVTSIELDGQRYRPRPPPSRPGLWAASAGLVLLIAALALALGARAGVISLALAPLLIAGIMAGWNIDLVAEKARATWLPVRWLPVSLPVAISLLLGGSALLWHGLRGFPWQAGLARLRGVGLGLGWALLAVAASWGMGAGRPAALAWAAGLALAWVLLIHANANAGRLRFYNLVCLALSAVLALGAEAWLRASPADRYWDSSQRIPGAEDIQGSLSMAERDFASIDQRVHTDYPDHGYPVMIAPPDGRLRLVVMGGSTTGGAWQNDDLDEFYPARLSAYLGGSHQVLNQGVGGWTTWHIRHYLEQGAIDPLAPELLVLYVGHNDLLTSAPQPYTQLYGRWARGGALAASSGWLNRIRLYQGLRYTLTALGPAERHAAVPLDDARDNLAWIIEQVTGRGGQVILMSEGLAPDPAPMQAYNGMMAQLAKEDPRVHYIDVASELHRHQGSRVFLDDCHLTAMGHDVVARLLLEQLDRMGALTGPPVELPPPPITTGSYQGGQRPDNGPGQRAQGPEKP